VGLELVVTGLLLPSLVVAGGELVGAGGRRDQDRGQQHDQLPGAAADPVRLVVLHDSHQVRLVRVEPVRRGGLDVLPDGLGGLGGGFEDRRTAPRPSDRWVYQHGQVGAVAQHR
jgi:hypothetical protein